MDLAVGLLEDTLRLTDGHAPDEVQEGESVFKLKRQPWQTVLIQESQRNASWMEEKAANM